MKNCPLNISSSFEFKMCPLNITRLKKPKNVTSSKTYTFLIANNQYNITITTEKV